MNKIESGNDMSKKAKNSPFRIAMIGHKRIPSREGGVEIVVEELSTRMASLGNSVTCYNRGGHHISGKEFDGEKLKEYKGVIIKTLPTINAKGLSAVTSSISGAILSAFGKYDIVHFHAEGTAVMCWFPKMFGKKTVVTIHGLDHQRAKWGKFAGRYIMLGEKNAVRYADEIIVLSEGIKKYFKEKYERETTFIPNGVSRHEIREADEIKKRFGLNKDEYILFVGRLVPEKGLTYLAEAFKGLDTDKKLVIAGSSSNTDEFVRNLKNMCSDDKRIIFTGFVQGKLLEELYSNAYCYVLPSDLEGMPLSLLEAMSYGNCCIVSDIAECTEVVEDKAVIFQKGDVKDLRSKIKMLCSCKEIVDEYKKSSADFICSKYSWEDVVGRTLKLYGQE